MTNYTIANAMKAFLVFALALTLLGCSTLQTDVAPSGMSTNATGRNGQLKIYKRAYIEALPKDEFHIYGALFAELQDMGMEVSSVPFKDPGETDLTVKYTYDAGWDVTRYLQAFQFQFINAKTGTVTAMTSFRSRGLWLGVRDGRLETAFNDLRAKNGYPPTLQFKH